MHDEESDFDKGIKSLGDTDPPLATELKCVQAQRVHMNNLHHTRIRQISELPCFTGSLESGIAVKHQHEQPYSSSGGFDRDMEVQDAEDDVVDTNEDDWVGEQLDALNTFILNLLLED